MWPQTYTPLSGSLAISATVAALPIFTLLILLGVMRKPAWVSSLAGLAAAAVVALAVYRMPFSMAASAAAYGAAYGLFPIGWIVFTAILLYRLTIETGKFAIIKDSIGSLTGDQRLQALLIAFAFGAFVEGAAGFGTPVAVAAAMLDGARIFAVLRRGDLSARQHLAGGVRFDRHAAGRSARGHRTADAGAFLRRRAPVRAGFAVRPDVPDPGDGRYESSARGSPGGGGLRRRIRGDAIFHLEFRRPVFDRYSGVARGHRRIGGAAARLEAEGRGSPPFRTAHTGGTRFPRMGPVCMAGDVRAAVGTRRRESPVLNHATYVFTWPGLHNLVQRMPPITPQPSNYAASYTLNCCPRREPRACSR